MSRPQNPIRDVRQRIREAAFSAFMEKGYSGTNTREIAARAKVSKQKLYELYEDKEAMLADCIKSRAARAKAPLDLREATDSAALQQAMEDFGTSFIVELSEPQVVAVYRLAILEAQKSPQVVRALKAMGMDATQQTLKEFFRKAQRAGLLDQGPLEPMARDFISLLWGDGMLSLLLGIESAPSEKSARKRAAEATLAWRTLYARE